MNLVVDIFCPDTDYCSHNLLMYSYFPAYFYNMPLVEISAAQKSKPLHCSGISLSAIMGVMGVMELFSCRWLLASEWTRSCRPLHPD